MPGARLLHSGKLSRRGASNADPHQRDPLPPPRDLGMDTRLGPAVLLFATTGAGSRGRLAAHLTSGTSGANHCTRPPDLATEFLTVAMTAATRRLAFSFAASPGIGAAKS